MEPFEESGLKGELDPIPCKLMKFDGVTLVVTYIEPSLSFFFNEVFTRERKKRDGRELGFWEL